MIHVMKLNAEPFEKIKSGNKTVELRLYDEKRRKLDIGDKIILTNNDDPGQEISVIVRSLHRYATFKDLFEDISQERCGFDSTYSPETAAEGMSEYYSDDQIQRYGVIGIEIELTDLRMVLEELDEHKQNVFDWFFPDGMK